jgi:hypothetical protein
MRVPPFSEERDRGTPSHVITLVVQSFKVLSNFYTLD